MSTKKQQRKDSLDMSQGGPESTTLSPEESVENAAKAFGVPLDEAKKAAK